MDATSGRPGFWSRVIESSRQTTSVAVVDPPGLSMRNTIARTLPSARAERMASTSTFEPATSPFSGSNPPWPEAMRPEM